MIYHYSVWGYRTACGKHLDSSRRLVRYGLDLLNCRSCLRTSVVRGVM